MKEAKEAGDIYKIPLCFEQGEIGHAGATPVISRGHGGGTLAIPVGVSLSTQLGVVGTLKSQLLLLCREVTKMHAIF